MKNTHPSQVFEYCPKCGASHFEFDDGLFCFKCSKCSFSFFINSSAAVAAIIMNDRQEVLFAIRGVNPHKGMLDLPGGFVDVGESAEEALSRELLEELGAKITSFEYLGSFPNKYEYGGIIYYTLDMAYVCQISSFDHLKAQDDITGYEFHNLAEFDVELLGGESMKNIIRSFKKNL